LSKAGFLESAGDFDRTVAAEVEENHRVAVFDGAHRLATTGDHERRQILVNGSRKLDAQRLDRRRCARVLLAFAEHVRVPAFLDHVPVGLVAVHGDVHPATPRGDAGVETIAADLGKESFERQDVFERTGFGDVTPVDQNVYPHRRYAFFPGAQDHRSQVVDVAVHIAVGEKADEVDHAATSLGAGDDLLPGSTLPDRAGVDGVGDQRGALAIDLAGADGIVADLGVAHVFVGRHADGDAMGAQGDVRAVGHEMVEGRFPGSSNGAAEVGFGDPVAVHDDRDDRTLNSRERGRFLQHDGFLAKWKDGTKAANGRQAAATTPVYRKRCSLGWPRNVI
jgi:hypothetical protein